MIPSVIGLAGYATAGKDSVADVLAERYGYVKVGFADALRECMTTLNPIIHEDGSRLGDVVDWWGYTAAKAHPVYGGEVRRLMQRMGTEVARGILGDDIWVTTLWSRLHAGQRYVIADVRFPNEARTVKAGGGVLWRVERPGVEPANGHVSETALEGWDYDAWVINDRSLADLPDEVDAALQLRRAS